VTPAPRGTVGHRYGAIAIFLLATLVYRGFRSNHFFFDSVHYARIAESGDNLFWQKHLLQHGLIRLLWLVQGEIAAPTNALRIAQWVNAVAAAGTVTLVFLCLRRYGGSSLAAAGALLFGLTGVVARLALEGEVHMLPLWFLALALWILMSNHPTPRAGLWAGLAMAGAILMHQSYVVFVPAVMAYYGVTNRAVRRTQLATLAGAAVPCILTYGLVFARAREPWTELTTWLLKDVGVTGWRWESLPRAGAAWLDALSPSGEHPIPLRLDGLAIAGLLLALVVHGVRNRAETTTPLLRFAGVAALLGVVAVVWHQPNFQYFSPMVLATVLAAAVGLVALPRRRAVALTWGATALCAVLSFHLLLRPVHDGRTNDALGRAAFVGERALRRDVVLSTGTGSAINDLHFLPYFARTRAVTLWQAWTRYGESQLLPGLKKLLEEAATTEGRLLVFGELVTPGKTFHGYDGTPLPVSGEDLRRWLATDYEWAIVATYQGAGYEEALLELRARRHGSAEGRPCGLGCPTGHECVADRCRCGPQPHFQLREGRCLPSCGVWLNQQVAPPAVSACCEVPCATLATSASKAWDTWDCAYCCGGAEGERLCPTPAD